MLTAYKNLTLALVRLVNAPRQQTYEQYRNKYWLKPAQKTALLTTGRLLVERRLAHAGTGEVSQRLAANQLAINARPSDLAWLDDEQLVVTSLERSVLGAARHLAWHQAIYAGTGAQGIVMGHPPHTLVLAHAGILPFETIASEIGEALGGVTIVPENEATKESLANLAGRYHALVVPGIGVIVWGNSLVDAMARLEALEYLSHLTALSQAR